MATAWILSYMSSYCDNEDYADLYDDDDADDDDRDDHADDCDAQAPIDA